MSLTTGGDALSLACTYLFWLSEAAVCHYLCGGTGAPDARRGRGRGRLLATATLAATALAACLLAGLFPIYRWQFTVTYCLLLAASMALAFGTGAKESLFYAIVFTLSVRTLRHFVSHICIVHTNTNFLLEGDEIPVRLLVITLNFGLCLGLAWLLRRFIEPQDVRRLGWPQMGIAVLAAIPPVYINDLVGQTLTDYAGQDAAAWAKDWPPVIMETVCSACGLLVIMGSERISRLRAAQIELAFSRRLIEQQHQQYLEHQKMTDEVNGRYHDIRAHLMALDAMQADAQRRRYVDELGRGLEAMHPLLRTGNEMLDIVLGEKEQRLESSGIELSIFADGDLISFMSPLDVTTIFGNALDNAIEATEGVADGPREILLRVEAGVEPYVMVCVENTFDGELPADGAASRKGAGHGYGLKNLTRAVEGYGGHVSVAHEGGRFFLTMLIPHP